MKLIVATIATAAFFVAASTAGESVSRNLTVSGDCLQYADNVDLPGYDFASQQASEASACWDECYPNRYCRAWTWTNYEGGTCWYKLGHGDAISYPGAVSGVTYPCGVPRGTQYLTVENCDMAGNDADNKPGRSFSECIGLSAASFTWSDLNGGTCWFKTRNVPCVYAPGKHTGILIH